MFCLRRPVSFRSSSESASPFFSEAFLLVVLVAVFLVEDFLALTEVAFFLADAFFFVVDFLAVDFAGAFFAFDMMLMTCGKGNQFE